MAEIATVTADDFESFTGKDGVTLVDFWAPWCGPCKAIAPVLEQLADEMDNVSIGKLNTDEHGPVAAAHGVMSIPTLMIFKNGEKVDQMVGAQPKDNLKAALEKHL